MKGVIPLRWLAPAFCSLILSACGGGGGGGGGGESAPPPVTPPQPEAPKQAAITQENAKALAFAGLRLTSYSDSAIYSSQYWFSNPWMLQPPIATRSNGKISIAHTEQCGESGEIRYTGELAENTLVGDLQFDYLDCSHVTGSSSSGRVKIQITAANTRQVPSAYVFTLENYRYQKGPLRITATGNIQVQPGTNGEIQATSNITLTDDNTGQTAQTKNLLSVYTEPAQYFYYPLLVQRSGSIEHSIWGVLDVSIATDRRERIILKGKKSGTLRLESFALAGARIAIDADDDGNHEGFLRIMDIDALLGSGGENTAPLYTPPTGLHAAENATLEILLAGNVFDDQNDFLSYAVRTISSPAGANLAPQLQEDDRISLTSAGPGNYVIELTIDDRRGGITVKQIAFRVQLPAPQPAANNINVTMNDGDTLSVDLSAQNPSAGPFSYQLVSGPVGMSIDSHGRLQWQPQVNQLFFPSLDVAASVKISNEDHAVTVPVSIGLKIASASEPLVRSAVALPTNTDGRQQIYVGDFDNDGRTEALLSDNKRLIYTLELDNGDYRQDWVYPYAEKAGNIDQILPIDLDNDGRHEIVVQRGNHLAVINENRSGIDREVIITTNDNSVYAKGMQLADLDSDGVAELIVVLGNNSWSTSGTQKAIVLNPATLTELWRTPDLSNTNGFAIGNADADPALELVFGGGYVFDGVSHANQWLYGSQFGTRIITADIDGDGIDEIIATAPARDAQAFSAVSKTLLWSIASTSGASLFAAQLDADPSQELLAEGSYYMNEVRIYDADQTSAVLTDTLTLPGYNSGNLVAHDLDQDGVDEIFRFAADGSSAYRLVVYNVATATTDYQNTDTQLLTAAWFGGFTLPSGGGSDLALFSGGNGRFATIDMNDGELTIAPAAHNNATGSTEFCLADYDGDNAMEILASAYESYSGVVFAYDLATQIMEWTRASNHSAYATTTCADLNGDGHADFVLNTADRVEAYDVLNQTLLWSIADASSGSSGDVVAADLNGDGKPEIIRADGQELVVYSSQGAGYAELRRIPLGYYSIMAILVTDIGDGGTPEIVAATSYFWGAGSMVVLNADLTERSRYSLPFRIAALERSPTGDATVLAGTTEDESVPFGTVTRHFIRSISLTDGTAVWRSPPLLGPVTPRSLHYHPAANSGNGGLLFGTQDAMYLTR